VIEPETCARVREVVDGDIRPLLKIHGGDLTIIQVVTDGRVELEFEGACRGCVLQTVTYAVGIRRRLLEVPGLSEVSMRGVNVSPSNGSPRDVQGLLVPNEHARLRRLSRSTIPEGAQALKIDAIGREFRFRSKRLTAVKRSKNSSSAAPAGSWTLVTGGGLLAWTKSGNLIASWLKNTGKLLRPNPSFLDPYRI
jgi:Fe-S cluster biogenesis protein NfuA